MICTGNICRSPMAEVVLQHLIDDESTLRGRVDVIERGWSGKWHGSPMDQRARSALNRAGFRGAGSLAAFADRTYLNNQDIVIGMTREHIHEVRKRLANDATEGERCATLSSRDENSTCSILTTATRLISTIA